MLRKEMCSYFDNIISSRFERNSLLQIVTYECTTAQINGAKPSTIDAWQCFLFNIRDCIGVTCFVFLLSFPLSLPFDWTFEILCICLLFCFVIF